MTAWQIEWSELSVESIGRASNLQIILRWFGKLLVAPRLLVCMDAHEAGEKAAAEVATLSLAVKRVQVRIGKDMNEFYLRAGQRLVCEWLKQVCDLVS